MAKITVGGSDQVMKISAFLGLNEAPEGDGTLKYGEAAEMENFRIAEGGALVKRPGSRSVAGLLASYAAETDDTETVTLITEREGDPMATVEHRPTVTVDGVGNIAATGTPANFTRDAAAAYAGWYRTEGGRVYSLGSVTKTLPDGAEPIPGGGAVYGELRPFAAGSRDYDRSFNPTGSSGQGQVCLYPAIEYTNGDLALTGLEQVIPGRPYLTEEPQWNYEGQGHYAWQSGRVYRYFGQYCTCHRHTDGTVTCYWQFYGYPVTGKSYIHRWNYHPVRAVAVPGTATGDTAVREIWTGYVSGREVICAACCGHLWELVGGGERWQKTDCGAIDTTGGVHMFGFDEKLWLLTSGGYMVWDGTRLQSVTGYRPLVAVSCTPDGVSEPLERVNRLTGERRCHLSPDGESTTFRLPEGGIATLDYARDRTTGQELAWSCDRAAGTITFTEVPEKGVNTIEVGYSMENNDRETVERMRYSELYNGTSDARVFLYGDGTGKAIYSDLDSEGRGRADYFPDLNEVAVGDLNTPVTGMIRHYSALLAFKPDSAYSIRYDAITLPDGTVTAGFYVTPVNRSVGNNAPGAVVLAENRPCTLDAGGVMEWKSTAGGNLTSDERNAELRSGRVQRTLRGVDLAGCRLFFDKIRHELWVVFPNGDAAIHNTAADAWYVYRGLGVRCLAFVGGEVYAGNGAGFLLRISDEYPDDDGSAISCRWVSGAMSFSGDFRMKYSPMLWLTLRGDAGARVRVSAVTDRGDVAADREVLVEGGSVLPRTVRVKLRARRFGWYKLALSADTAGAPLAVLAAEVRSRSAGYVV